MSKVYITSDLHLGHENLCQGLRGMSAKESDDLIISNWNKVVKKQDKVIVVGDFVMEKHQLIEGYVKRLNGTIVLVGGNHDTPRCCKEFAILGITVMGALNHKGFMITHIPIRESQMRDWSGNIHGHLHLSGTIEGLGEYKPQQLQGRYYNVNTEFHNYTPILFDDVEKYFIEHYGDN